MNRAQYYQSQYPPGRRHEEEYEPYYDEHGDEYDNGQNPEPDYYENEDDFDEMDGGEMNEEFRSHYGNSPPTQMALLRERNRALGHDEPSSASSSYFPAATPTPNERRRGSGNSTITSPTTSTRNTSSIQASSIEEMDAALFGSANPLLSIGVGVGGASTSVGGTTRTPNPTTTRNTASASFSRPVSTAPTEPADNPDMTPLPHRDTLSSMRSSLMDESSAWDMSTSTGIVGNAPQEPTPTTVPKPPHPFAPAPSAMFKPSQAPTSTASSTLGSKEGAELTLRHIGSQSTSQGTGANENSTPGTTPRGRRAAIINVNLGVSKLPEPDLAPVRSRSAADTRDQGATFPNDHFATRQSSASVQPIPEAGAKVVPNETTKFGFLTDPDSAAFNQTLEASHPEGFGEEDEDFDAEDFSHTKYDTTGYDRLDASVDRAQERTSGAFSQPDRFGEGSFRQEQRSYEFDENDPEFDGSDHPEESTYSPRFAANTQHLPPNDSSDDQHSIDKWPNDRYRPLPEPGIARKEPDLLRPQAAKDRLGRRLQDPFQGKPNHGRSSSAKQGHSQTSRPGQPTEKDRKQIEELVRSLEEMRHQNRELQDALTSSEKQHIADERKIADLRAKIAKMRAQHLKDIERIRGDVKAEVDRSWRGLMEHERSMHKLALEQYRAEYELKIASLNEALARSITTSKLLAPISEAAANTKSSERTADRDQGGAGTKQGSARFTDALSALEFQAREEALKAKEQRLAALEEQLEQVKATNEKAKAALEAERLQFSQEKVAYETTHRAAIEELAMRSRAVEAERSQILQELSRAKEMEANRTRELERERTTLVKRAKTLSDIRQSVLQERETLEAVRSECIAAQEQLREAWLRFQAECTQKRKLLQESERMAEEALNAARTAAQQAQQAAEKKATEIEQKMHELASLFAKVKLESEQLASAAAALRQREELVKQMQYEAMQFQAESRNSQQIAWGVLERRMQALEEERAKLDSLRVERVQTLASSVPADFANRGSFAELARSVEGRPKADLLAEADALEQRWAMANEPASLAKIAGDRNRPRLLELLPSRRVAPSSILSRVTQPAAEGSEQERMATIRDEGAPKPAFASALSELKARVNEIGTFISEIRPNATGAVNDLEPVSVTQKVAELRAESQIALDSAKSAENAVNSLLSRLEQSRLLHQHEPESQDSNSLNHDLALRDITPPSTQTLHDSEAEDQTRHNPTASHTDIDFGILNESF